ncbi:MAG: DUF2752 domain-containing protein [Acidimicrobiales bacterium]|nr:DUF2752 domain-containing protein [Acidimicrobiales bacterium]
MTALAAHSPRSPVPHPVRSWTLGRSAANLAVAGAGLVALRATPLPGLPCPMLAITGIPCPGCGMTRAASAVAAGDLGHAVATDPAAVALVAAMGVLAIAYAVLRFGTRARNAPRWAHGWALPAAMGLLLATHWAITALTGGFVT